MKGVILAAGRGTRLGASIPKPLTILNDGRTILDFQIEGLSRKIGGHNMIVVVGYKKELILKKFPYLIYIYNKNYAKTNTGKSLLLALKRIEDDAIWMNGDVYFDEGILDLLINSKYSCCLVDQKNCGAEEVKYDLKDRFINKLSKVLDKAEGEALGINIIRKSDIHNFREALEKIEDTDYFEKALENLVLANKLKLEPIQVRNLFCKEIDFQNDIESVKTHLSSH